MKDSLKTIAWISGGIGIVMMLIGTAAVLSGGILWNHMWSNYFYPAYNFLLLGIFLFLGHMVRSKSE